MARPTTSSCVTWMSRSMCSGSAMRVHGAGRALPRRCRGAATSRRTGSRSFSLGNGADMLVVLAVVLIVSLVALVLWRREVARRLGAQEAAARAEQAQAQAQAERDEARRA